MAYSPIEQRYLDMVVEAYFPTLPPEPVPAEPSLEGMQLAMGGGAGQYRKDLPITDVGMGMLDMGAATVKGVTQGFVGLPGDLEAIAYGIKEIVTRPEGEGKLEAFLRGIDQKTILPTTEEVKTWLDKNVGMVGDGKSPYESIGEVVAPGGQIKAGKAAVKGAKAAAKKTVALVPSSAKEALIDAVLGADSKEQLLRQFVGSLDTVSGSEKFSDPSTWTVSERKAWDAGNWKAFSKLRGYTDKQISEFQSYLDLSAAVDKEYGSDTAQGIVAAYNDVIQQRLKAKENK